MNCVLTSFLKLLLFVLLTILTQIGGVLYIFSELLVSKKATHRRYKKISLFIGLYICSTFLIVPYLAPVFGREKIKNNDVLEAHSTFTIFCNRNYVTPQLNAVLLNIAKTINDKHNTIKLIYLDANFPFITGFPLLPHLSHRDGKKIDISLIYKNEKNKITNKKPAIFGYGVYEDLDPGEYNQIRVCKKKGYWQYDFAKYLTFGILNKQLKLSEKATKDLLLTIVKEQKVRKVFIEPHLKNRLGLQSSKIRFHGCQAVRHDDHIHVQL
ncbi:hypothetical protein ACWGOQ_0017680 [Aquimarina sp. M1]